MVSALGSRVGWTPARKEQTNERTTLRGAKMRHRSKFCADRSRRCGDIAVFDFSRWRPSAILDFQKLGNFNCPYPSGGAKMRHHAKFCADRSRRCGDMAVFFFSTWRTTAILDFQKLEILTAYTLRRAKMRHHAKLSADRSNRCGDTAVFNFSILNQLFYLGLF